MALSVIASQSFGWRQFTGRTVNGIGIDIPSYAPSVLLRGSVQPVPRTLFQELGLDWKRKYITIFNFHQVTGVERDSAGDRVDFDGKEFQVLSEDEWTNLDGWSETLCVEVPPDV